MPMPPFISWPFNNLLFLYFTGLKCSFFESIHRILKKKKKKKTIKHIYLYIYIYISISRLVTTAPKLMGALLE